MGFLSRLSRLLNDLGNILVLVAMLAFLLYWAHAWLAFLLGNLVQL